MATKRNKKAEQSTLTILKNKAQELNTVALETTNEIVEETLATGEQWQNVFAKALRKGTDLFARQQDLTLNGLVLLKKQFEYSTKRTKQLLAAPKTKTVKAKTTAKRPAAKAKADQGIDQLMEATIKAEKVTKKAIQTAAKKTTKPAAKKAAPAKKNTRPSTTAKSTKLTVIEGIGPKIQELLNNAGIKTYDQLAAASPADLKETLLAAGTRFQMHDPSTWPAQAKLAAAGKMDELAVLQEELKGGK